MDINMMMKGLSRICQILGKKGRLELKFRPDLGEMGVWMIILDTLTPHYQVLARGDSPEQVLAAAAASLRPSLEKRHAELESELTWMNVVLEAKNG
jgi:hypothetical protein